MANSDQSPAHGKLSPNAKLAVELGPLVVFLIASSRLGLVLGTAVFIVAMLVAVGISWKVERKVAPLTWVTLAMVVVFGGLTVWLGDESFIKLKVTVIEVFIGAALLGGLAFGKLFAKSLLGMALPMNDAGWHAFTVRFALFSFALAGANEYVRRAWDDSAWLWFKVGGLPLATFAFMLAQMPLVKRHALPGSQDPDAS
ncbi:MAG: septation protein IspZ [Planctomycetes bacterium]|nr:septation protein IspZ [Planctomycetota bacterium]